ncbi:sensor histidine kinase [Paenibacillus thermotolerans]|uniref:sensor histidine kinase n=1 Tax=Paenibacillus thermotolerans TaxID=3027807 RepID=UPI002368526E|nr:MULTISPECIES: histidine kinase [unclassified Paenibacillus]
MRFMNKSLLNSIRIKLILGLIAVVLPILVFLIYNNLYSIQLVRDQVAQSNSNLLKLYMGLIDKDLESIDSYLFLFAANDTSLNRLDRPAHQQLDLYNLAKYQVFRTLYENSSTYTILDYFFVYSIENRDLLLAPNSTFVTGGTDTSSVRDKIQSIVQDRNQMKKYPYDSWSSLRINEQSYLIHVIKRGEIYVGALANYNRITGPLDLLDLGTNGRSLLVDADDEPLQDAAFYEEQQINLNDIPNGYRLTGDKEKYMVIGEKSSKGDFSLLAVLPDRNILAKLPYTQRVIAVITAGTVLILAGALFLLRRIILLPINRILTAMRKLRDGHLDTRIKSTPTSNEFQLMNETFNNMVSEIQKLKIEIYEEQLLGQKAELKHLQLQINPHFYLNSLNTFYYLAEDANTTVIKELSLSLIQYFRFMFRSGHSDFVSLADEINHAENYLRIQHFRFPNYLTYSSSVADSLMECRVPPLIIQMFAENAVKYALTLDEPIHIQMTVRQDEASPEGRLRIQIRDTGKGFPEDVLEQIKRGTSLMNEAGEHVGIWNVKRRLWLLFGDQADIAFYNDHGAVVEMTLPQRLGSGGSEHVLAAYR